MTNLTREFFLYDNFNKKILSNFQMDYGCQLYNTASAGRLKKLDSIHRKGIRIYTGAFRTSLSPACRSKRPTPGTKKERTCTKIHV